MVLNASVRRDERGPAMPSIPPAGTSEEEQTVPKEQKGHNHDQSEDHRDQTCWFFDELHQGADMGK